MRKPKIGISIGDVNGIGLEVILKALNDPRVLNMCTPIIYGASKVVSYHKNVAELESINFHNINSPDRAKKESINVLNCWNENINITIGVINEVGGKYAKISLEAATQDLKSGTIDALVTAPIHKKSMQLAGFEHTGHTEYLTQELGQGQSLMLMVNDQLRIGLVTNHLPIREVAEAVTMELIEKKIEVMHKSLRRDFGIDRPKIAVLALNPHAGDEGLIGSEEIDIIVPAIKNAKRKGMLAMGPYPADGFFGAGKHTKVDGILAMYHDQGLVPFKALSFGAGVNFTAGLKSVRTSPDHGTAHDIAGTNQANPSSFRAALFLAIDTVRNRFEFDDRTKNPIRKSSNNSSKEDEILQDEDQK